VKNRLQAASSTWKLILLSSGHLNGYMPGFYPKWKAFEFWTWRLSVESRKWSCISSGFSRMCCGFKVNESLLNMFSFVCLIAVLSFQGKVHFPCGRIRQLHRRLHRRWSKIWNYGDCDENVCGYMLSRKTKTHCLKTVTGGIQVLSRMWLRRASRGIPWNK